MQEEGRVVKHSSASGYEEVRRGGCLRRFSILRLLSFWDSAETTGLAQRAARATRRRRVEALVREIMLGDDNEGDERASGREKGR
jgi:hypothetical protein